jgi:hypothetical protein
MNQSPLPNSSSFSFAPWSIEHRFAISLTADEKVSAELRHPRRYPDVLRSTSEHDCYSHMKILMVLYSPAYPLK